MDKESINQLTENFGVQLSALGEAYAALEIATESVYDLPANAAEIDIRVAYESQRAAANNAELMEAALGKSLYLFIYPLGEKVLSVPAHDGKFTLHQRVRVTKGLYTGKVVTIVGMSFPEPNLLLRADDGAEEWRSTDSVCGIT